MNHYLHTRQPASLEENKNFIQIALDIVNYFER